MIIGTEDPERPTSVAHHGKRRSLNTWTASENVSIIAHSHLRWNFVWQRPQQILSRLAKDHAVLFIEEPLWRDEPPALRIDAPSPGVVRVAPLLRQADHPTVETQCAAVLPLLSRILREHLALRGRFDDAIDWFYSPMTAPLLMGKLARRAVVYDCMDELANFRFAPQDIAERERFLLSHADVVFTGGFGLFETKSRHHGNVHFYGCGVDFNHYEKARLPSADIPSEVACLPRPILGYFGVIDERIDYPLLERLAVELPKASIVMVGPLAKIGPADLPRRPNIHWLGQRSYDALPALVKSYDVCLMPFALNEATRYINPTKTLEYMAAGKPVVSSTIPDVVRLFTPVVAVASSHHEFIQSVKQALDAPNADLIEAGITQARNASWDAMVAEMRGHMLQAAAERTAAGKQAHVDGAYMFRKGSAE